MNKLQSLVLAIILLVGGVSVATPQDFDKGMDAWVAGDYQTALIYFKDIADGPPYAYGYWVDEDCDVRPKNSCFLVPIGTNGPAEFYLGLMYQEGQGVLQNYVEAFRLYHLVAEQGDASSAGAQYRLGSMYQNGQGVTQNNVLAHMWYNIAAFIGSSSGYSRDEVEKLMTTAEVSKAQQMARECMSSNYQNCGY